MEISRRDFSRFLAMTGSVLLPKQLEAWPAPLAQTPARPDERFWLSVREQFLMPADLAVMNAANLCPSPAPVLEAHERIHPSIISAYSGTIGISRRPEAMGQRDEPAIIGFGEAILFETTIGVRAIEQRSRALAQGLIAGLRRIDGVHIWTHPDPIRSGAVVTFRPGALDIPRLAAALYKNDRIGCATRTGSDRPGIRCRRTSTTRWLKSIAPSRRSRNI